MGTACRRVAGTALVLFAALPSACQQGPPQTVLLAAGEGGLQVVDATRPATPRVVATVPTSTTIQAVAVAGDTAYLAETGPGLRVLDVSQPAQPRELGALVPGNVDARDVAVAGSTAFLAAGVGGLRVIDVADPAQPGEVGHLPLDAPALARAVAVAGDHAYLADGFQLRVVNVADPTRPLQEAALDLDAVDVAVAGGHAYVVGPQLGLCILDIAQPAAPRRLGCTPVPGEARGLAVVGDTALVAAGPGGGLRVVDVADPRQPRELAVAGGGGVNAVAVAVAPGGERAYLAAGGEGLHILDTARPAALRELGTLGPPAAGAVIGLAIAAAGAGGATPEATVAAADASPAPTEVASLPTATFPSSPTAPATATVPATPFIPVVTREPGRAWVRQSGDASPLPASELRAVAVDGDGTVWWRVAGAPGTADQVVTRQADGTWQAEGTLAEAVARHAEAIRRQGSLDGFWAVDPVGRIWIGPLYFQGGEWTIAAQDEEQSVGGQSYEDRAVVDATGRVWVPFQNTGPCPGLTACPAAGLRSMAVDDQPADSILFDPLPEADEYGLPSAFLVAGRAAARRALHDLPEPAAVPYPELVDPAAQAGPPAGGVPRRNAGYATAATIRPDGRLQTFTWIEEDRGAGVAYRLAANTWNGTGWDPPEDLGDGPLTPAGARFVRLVAAEHDPAGTLWLASSDGALALRRDGRWLDVFPAAELGLAPGERIRDITFGPDGAVWLATTAGGLTYAPPAP
jgi:hypothetical protein